MGRMKQYQMELSATAEAEIEDLLSQVEQEVERSGVIARQTFDEVCKAFLAYAEIWPTDDMSQYGGAFIRAIRDGRTLFEADRKLSEVMAGS